MQMSSIDVIASALGPAMPGLGEFSSPDGAVTLMLTDIADASAVADRLGPERWATLLRDHETLVRQLVSHHDGTVVRAEQDGFLASFPSAHGGLHCAVELAQTLAGNTGTADGTEIAVRTGLHSGFVISANPEQLMGRNVVLAARIAGKATAGEILVSSTLKEYTERDPSFAFAEKGEFHFKGVLGEHVVYSVSWDQPAA